MSDDEFEKALTKKYDTYYIGFPYLREAAHWGREYGQREAEAEINRLVRDLLARHRPSELTDPNDGVWLYLDERDRQHGGPKAWVVIDEISTGEEFVDALRKSAARGEMT
jgi:hypothetical protein